MRILLDQNLSPKLIQRLADMVPGLESVYVHDLVGAPDATIFHWAREAQFAVVISADRDFVQLAEEHGAPPKVIRIARCDFPARVIEQLLRREEIRFLAFFSQTGLFCF